VPPELTGWARPPTTPYQMHISELCRQHNNTPGLASAEEEAPVSQCRNAIAHVLLSLSLSPKLVPSENQLHWLCRPRSYEQPTQIVHVENENLPCPLNGNVIFRAYMVVLLPDRTLGHDKRWNEEFFYSFLRKGCA
jgi:hypothetical protein